MAISSGIGYNDDFDIVVCGYMLWYRDCSEGQEKVEVGE